jgi:chromosome segregation ATPase
MSVEAQAQLIEQTVERLEEEVARLRGLLADKDTQIERLTLRVLTKDNEFAKERAHWNRQKRTLETALRAARKVNH